MPGKYKTETEIRDTVQASLRKAVDEFGELQEKLEPFHALRAKAEELRSSILWHVGDTLGHDAARTIAGDRFEVTLSARKMESTVNCKALARYMGAQKFVAIAKVAMKDLLNALTGAEAEKFVTSARTGPRVVTAARRGDIRV